MTRTDPAQSLPNSLVEQSQPTNLKQKPTLFVILPVELRLEIYRHCSAYTLLQLAHVSARLHAEINGCPEIFKKSYGYWHPQERCMVCLADIPVSERWVWTAEYDKHLRHFDFNCFRWKPDFEADQGALSIEFVSIINGEKEWTLFRTQYGDQVWVKMKIRADILEILNILTVFNFTDLLVAHGAMLEQSCHIWYQNGDWTHGSLEVVLPKGTAITNGVDVAVVVCCKYSFV
ncbi:hypothetical protein BJ508DRAFT_343622 [Ascobolus immersus RN42]|uniref:F-box domain-containing protein n=1 Tax=Ascobolus immersus RN42 TaxID=1160509 RepID=A0A3N4IML4_ASCIM|nr:hypothetical protein BJ508DRAFT_343622 [Ascobolus immersus RN42]